MPPRQARILPFPPPRWSAPPGGPPPRRSPAGVVATLSIDAKEVARLVARDLADHQRRSGPPSSSAPVPCGAPRRHPPHAPCRSTGRLANGRCRWHQGPERTSTQVQSRRPRSTNARALSGSAFSESPEPWAHRQRPADSHGEEGPIGVDLTLTNGSHDIGLLSRWSPGHSRQSAPSPSRTPITSIWPVVGRNRESSPFCRHTRR